MGMDERAFASISALWTCFLIETKCDDSFSAASGESRGAHRLVLSVKALEGSGRKTYDLQ